MRDLANFGSWEIVSFSVLLRVLASLRASNVGPLKFQIGLFFKDGALPAAPLYLDFITKESAIFPVLRLTMV